MISNVRSVFLIFGIKLVFLRALQEVNITLCLDL